MPHSFSLSLRPISRRFSISSASAAVLRRPPTTDGDSKKKTVIQEPALVRLKKERDPDRLFNLFKANALNRLVVENRYVFEDTVSRLAGAGRFDYIEQLLEQQKSLPQGRREGFMVRLITLYGRVGMTKQALDTFFGLHFFGCKRTVKSFNAALKVLIGSRDPEAIDSFLEEVPCRFGIQMDAVSFNIMVSAFCGMGYFDRAYLVLIQMEKLGLRPDVVTYTTLIWFLYKKGDWQIANGLWNLMVRKGCYPVVATFNARIHFLVSRGRAWEANELVALMESISLQPDEVTYNLVIKGFCRAGYLDMAKRVYSALHGRGYKPNAKIYQTMVHYLCENGELDEAYIMCKCCYSENCFLNMGTVHKLIQDLKKNGRVAKANVLLALSRKKHRPSSEQELGTSAPS